MIYHKKKWHEEAKAPIITIGTYDTQKDNIYKNHFLKVFYGNLFNRKKIMFSF